ncbi:hypothetical protein Agub_g15778, partial [Astrephomene gubernaculifera]
ALPAPAPFPAAPADGAFGFGAAGVGGGSAGFGGGLVAGAGGAGGGGTAAGAATTLTVAYPRCSQLMSAVHSSEPGRLKTPLMLLNEYAARTRLLVAVAEVPSPSPLAGPFRFTVSLCDPAGTVLLQVAGVECRSKQDARQAAASAALEQLME